MALPFEKSSEDVVCEAIAALLFPKYTTSALMLTGIFTVTAPSAVRYAPALKLN